MGPASRAATGLLQVAGGRISAVHLALRQHCRKGYDAFLLSLNEALGLDSPLALNEVGHFRLTAEQNKLPSLQSFASTLRGLGVEAEFLDQQELWAIEPSLRELAVGAVRLKDATVESERLLDGLEQHLTALGVPTVPTAVFGVEDGGVSLQGGQRVDADAIVLACGAGLSKIWNPVGWTAREDPGWRLSFQGELDLCHSVEWSLPQNAGGTLVPTSERGWWVGGSGNPAPEELELEPGLASLCGKGAQVARHDGVRMTVDDGLPVVGSVADFKGLYLLTGLGRNGLLTAPVLARGLAEIIHTGDVPDWLQPFGPGRPQIGSRRPWSR